MPFYAEKQMKHINNLIASKTWKWLIFSWEGKLLNKRCANRLKSSSWISICCRKWERLAWFIVELLIRLINHFWITKWNTNQLFRVRTAESASKIEVAVSHTCSRPFSFLRDAGRFSVGDFADWNCNVFRQRRISLPWTFTTSFM